MGAGAMGPASAPSAAGGIFGVVAGPFLPVRIASSIASSLTARAARALAWGIRRGHSYPDEKNQCPAPQTKGAPFAVFAFGRVFADFAMLLWGERGPCIQSGWHKSGGACRECKKNMKIIK